MTATLAPRRGTTAGVLVLRVLGAAALAAIAAIHLHLWREGYDQIETIGPAFLVQTVLGFGGAVLVLLAPGRLLAVAAALGALFSLGSLLALLQSTTGLFGTDPGLFGFTESKVAPWWEESFWVEIAGVVVLGLLAFLARGRRAR